MPIGSSDSPTGSDTSITNLSEVSTSLLSNPTTSSQGQPSPKSPVHNTNTSTIQPVYVARTYATSRMAAHSMADLPLPGTKGAPKKFKGKHSDVEPFLYFYERLCTKHSLTHDQDKIDSLVHYCSRTVRETLEGLKSYEDKDWTRFLEDFKTYYEAERDKKRFRISDLNRYTTQMSKQKIKDLAGFRKYTRGFVRIAGWLLQKHKITEREYKVSL